jgi:hypothetical protein
MFQNSLSRMSQQPFFAAEQCAQRRRDPPMFVTLITHREASGVPQRITPQFDKFLDGVERLDRCSRRHRSGLGLLQRKRE